MPHKTNNKKTWTKVLFLIAMAVCILGFITSPIALVGGFLFTYFFGHPFLNLSGKAVSWLLKVAVVGLGFGMNLLETWKPEKPGFPLTFPSISVRLIWGNFTGS